MAESRTRLVILFGGQSAEHDISRITARHVVAAADPNKYEIFPVGIDRSGTWHSADEALALLQSNRVSELGESLSVQGQEIVPTDVATSTAATVVFPLLHGPMGEDGTVQGLLELAGLPFIGCGVLSSALSMDKVAAKKMAQANGIPQGNWCSSHRVDLIGAQRDEAMSKVIAQLSLPIFVKPANCGSSIGISKASTVDQLSAAIDEALRFDDWIVFEEAINGREIEVAVLGHTYSPRASVPGEIKPAAEFYDYNDKYNDGAAQLDIPASLPKAEADIVRALACEVFRHYRCEGMARVDFFYEENGRGWLLNEVNTIPGFTPISMYPKMWEATGLPYRALIDELVHLALERHNETQRYRNA